MNSDTLYHSFFRSATANMGENLQFWLNFREPPGSGQLPAVLYFFFLKILLRKRITFITRKNATRIASVSPGCLGAMVASSISGKPKTMAGCYSFNM